MEIAYKGLDQAHRCKHQINAFSYWATSCRFVRGGLAWLMVAAPLGVHDDPVVLAPVLVPLPSIELT